MPLVISEMTEKTKTKTTHTFKLRLHCQWPILVSEFIKKNLI